MTEGKFIPGNQSANTPDLYESELRRLQMPELQELARQQGIPNADQLRRDDLIKEISLRNRESGDQPVGAGGQRQGGGQQAREGGQPQTAGQQAGGGGQPTEGKFMPGNQSADTPDLYESELRRLQMPELQELARQQGIPNADQLRRDDLIKEISLRNRERQLHPQA
ncbi:MAG TPA: Rho termination factor N-terminal domain-containing protein [Planosporangium sp.]|jgi:hypothetical protein|nr:Rho termination factor N-terminal domain-containing protein [Planosporangium sp.]